MVSCFIINRFPSLRKIICKVCNSLIPSESWSQNSKKWYSSVYLLCARESRCDPFANLKVTPLQVTFAKV